jgi:pyrimidine-nucleoside phosphorylase
VNFLSLIEAKRDGQSLSADAVAELIGSFVRGAVPDYQMAAFLMAIYFRGLTGDETTALTLAMRDSGDKLVFPGDARPLVDKHSTGGVGDKVSLPLAPLLACLGFRVPMISGRGLGITGGTLDKLDSIPGFQTMLPPGRIIDIVQETGCVICGQTDRMVPADKAMYALRDVTGTVPSIPLIVASILSKKLAESLDALILDVKFGQAAFMKTREQARDLAGTMVRLGNKCGTATRALLTDMDTPLGKAAGNWLEIRETVACLEGRGPADLREIVLACAAHLLLLTKCAPDLSTALRKSDACLASGAPLLKWEGMLAAQGANLEQYRSKLARNTTPPAMLEIKASASGFVQTCNARIIGEVIRELGGGRLTKDSQIDYDVGVDSIAKPGDQVSSGSPLARIHGRSLKEAQTAAVRLQSAFSIGPDEPAIPARISEIINA